MDKALAISFSQKGCALDDELSCEAEKALKDTGEISEESIVEGCLNKETVIAEVGSRTKSIEYCYEAELQSNKSLKGKVEIGFVIEADGSVPFADIEYTSINNQKLEGCIIRVFSELRFPSCAKYEYHSTTAPFNFIPASELGN